MDELIKLIEILVWPITVIIVVLVLRSPLSALVPTLKRLKYKDLELEFEREASKILSEAERDLPEIEEKPKEESKEPRVMFARKRIEPVAVIMHEWRNLELALRKYAESTGVESGSTIRSLIHGLSAAGTLTDEAANIILELSALRNKVTHTDEEAITYETSAAFAQAVRRVLASLEVCNA